MEPACPELKGSEFTRDLTTSQPRLFSYIHSLLPDNAASWDVLQETNLVLWDKKDQFQEGSNFFAWAATIARYQVMAYLRDRGRDPLQVLTPELLDAFAEEAESESALMAKRRQALGNCLKGLSDKGKTLLSLHYDESLSTEQIGYRLGAKGNAIKQALFRIRRKLQDCIDLSLAK